MTTKSCRYAEPVQQGNQWLQVVLQVCARLGLSCWFRLYYMYTSQLIFNRSNIASYSVRLDAVLCSIRRCAWTRGWCTWSGRAHFRARTRTSPRATPTSRTRSSSGSSSRLPATTSRGSAASSSTASCSASPTSRPTHSLSANGGKASSARPRRPLAMRRYAIIMAHSK